MTNEDLAQLAQQLNAEQRDKLIDIVCGPEEDWSEATGEFVMRVYGLDSKPDPVAAQELIRKIIREKRDRCEAVEQELLNLLDQLEKRAAHALRQGQ